MNSTVSNSAAKLAALTAERERLQKDRDQILSRFDSLRATDPADVRRLNRKIGTLTVTIEALRKTVGGGNRR